MYRWLFLILLVCLIGGWWYVYEYDRGITIREMLIGGHPFIDVGDVRLEVEVANSEAERTRGLSGRDEIRGIDGLFMVFEEPGYHGIWMKDMRFPIDVIWISEGKKVVDIVSNMRPESYPTIYEPNTPAKYILETKAFFVSVYGVRVGDNVSIPSNIKAE